MARNPHGIITSIWAESGDVESPADIGITVQEGYDRRYSLSRGRKIEREGVNYWLRELYSFAKDANEHGALEWHANMRFPELPTLILGSDGQQYVAQRPSGPGTANAAIDPTLDGTRQTWRPYGEGTFSLATHTHPSQSFTLPQADESMLGGVIRASNAEHTAGLDRVKYVTPRGIRIHGDARYRQLSVTIPDSALPVVPITKGGSGSTTASDARTAFGLGSAAREDVGNTSGDLVQLDSGNLIPVARLPNSSTGARGVIETATETEAEAGTDTVRAITTKGVRVHGDARYQRFAKVRTFNDLGNGANTGRNGEIGYYTGAERSLGISSGAWAQVTGPAGIMNLNGCTFDNNGNILILAGDTIHLYNNGVWSVVSVDRPIEGEGIAVDNSGNIILAGSGGPGGVNRRIFRLVNGTWVTGISYPANDNLGGVAVAPNNDILGVNTANNMIYRYDGISWDTGYIDASSVSDFARGLDTDGDDVLIVDRDLNRIFRYSNNLWDTVGFAGPTGLAPSGLGVNGTELVVVNSTANDPRIYRTQVVTTGGPQRTVNAGMIITVNGWWHNVVTRVSA